MGLSAAAGAQTALAASTAAPGSAAPAPDDSTPPDEPSDAPGASSDAAPARPVAPLVDPAQGVLAPGMVPVAGPAVPVDQVDDYRWQILVADAATLALLVPRSEDSAKIAVLSYAFTAPIIHLTHERGGRALSSLLLRMGLPLTGAMTGAMLAGNPCRAGDYDCEDEGQLVAAVLGFGVGALTAMVVDATAIARPIHKRETIWAPQVSTTRDRVTLGVMGQF